MFLIVLLVVIVALVWIGVWIGPIVDRSLQAKKEQEKTERIKADFFRFGVEMISEHVQTLARKCDQLVTVDEYGNYQLDAWSREMDYFIDTTILASCLTLTFEERFAFRNKIRELVLEYKKSHIYQFDCDIDTCTPEEFERACSEVLNGCGWESRVTRSTGDQGVDVVATYGSLRAVFQCKKYSQPVGNAAVQEITAGKAFEQADVAAVVTNSTYTPAARQLAGMTDVHLLHYTDLSSFAITLGLAEE